MACPRGALGGGGHQMFRNLFSLIYNIYLFLYLAVRKDSFFRCKSERARWKVQSRGAKLFYSITTSIFQSVSFSLSWQLRAARGYEILIITTVCPEDERGRNKYTMHTALKINKLSQGICCWRDQHHYILTLLIIIIRLSKIVWDRESKATRPFDRIILD